MNPVVGRGILEPHFWPLSWLPTLEDSANDLEVHLIGLDSCSGLSKVSPSQVLSVGAIDPAELADAQILLVAALKQAKSCGRSVIRVVMIHHPPDKLTRSSRRDFEDWLKKNRIHAILTGHTHVPLQQMVGTTGSFELRCGTTLQAGTSTHLPGRKPNHFYVHGLEPSPTGMPQMDWRSLEYWHTGLSWVCNGIPVWNQTVTAL